MIGTALINVAVQNNVEVYAILRPNTSRKDRLASSDLVHPIYCFLEDLSGIEEIPSDCDVLYHFAWAGTKKSERDDPIIQERNIKSTLDAVELARKTGCKKFIGAGSQAEYGPQYKRIDGNTIFNPTLSYGIAKHSAFQLSRKLCEKKGITHIWGRVFSIYGPHDNEDTLIDYALKCWNDRKVPEFSSGLQKWNYLYEDDAGRMFFEMGKPDIPSCELIVANTDSRLLKEYILDMMRVYGQNAKAVFHSVEQEVSPGLDVDMSNTFRVLNYRPLVSFGEGIAKVIAERK